MQFRIRPEGRSLYFEVNVHPDQAAMLAHFRRVGGRKFERANVGTVANCQGKDCYRVGKDGRMKKTGCVGEINVTRTRLDVEVVVHEVTHAALRWAWRIGLTYKDFDSREPHVSESEERFCYAVGRMADEFMSKLQKRGVWGLPPTASMES